jgi:amidase
LGVEIGPFSTASEMLAALDAGLVSSVELVDMHLERIDEHDGELNAIAVRTTARARESAIAAAAARASASATRCSGCR